MRLGAVKAALRGAKLRIVALAAPEIGFLALAIELYRAITRPAGDRRLLSIALGRQPQQGQRYTREAEAEFLQRTTACDGFGQALGQLIEFVVHNFPFDSVLLFCLALQLLAFWALCSPACSHHRNPSK